MLVAQIRACDGRSKRYEGFNLGPSLYLKPRWLGTIVGLQFSTQIHQIHTRAAIEVKKVRGF